MSLAGFIPLFKVDFNGAFYFPMESPPKIFETDLERELEIGSGSAH